MEELRSINSNDETPAGNYAGRRRRLQQDCTVKLFPPISPSTVLDSPTNQEPAETATAARNSHKGGRGHHTCCCCCKCKKDQRSRCNSRMIDSALSSCSSSSTASSWSSCSSRSSAASASSNCSNLVLDRESSTLRALSRSREVKNMLKRIAEELASDGGGGGDIGHGQNENVRSKGGVLGDSRGIPHAPPSSRVLTGAHFLDWYIPQHIAGSRALNRSAKSAAAKRTEIASPMHKPEKQAWITQIIDPKTTSLPLPHPPKPPVIEHPCPRADNLWEAFSKDQINVNPYIYASHLANSNYLSNSFPPPRFSAIRPHQSALASKSLLLQGREGYLQGGFPHPGVAEPLSGPVFTKSQVPNKTWFIVHPDWRLEPRPGEDV